MTLIPRLRIGVLPLLNTLEVSPINRSPGLATTKLVARLVVTLLLALKILSEKLKILLYKVKIPFEKFSSIEVFTMSKFPTEKDIFDVLHLDYRPPCDRDL